MKKLRVLATFVLISMVAMAQTNQVVWLNGRAVLGQPICQMDSILYGEMSESDTLFFLLPRKVVVHDTVFVPHEVPVHDTIYIYKCDSSHAPAGVEMVDLGLSVKWANMNVGATTVTGYGDYFAWGETSPKTDYSWSTYKYCNGSSTSFTKYCTKSNYGTVDNKTTLEAQDDAAHVNWGGNWRMPTHTEQKELYDNCTITWTTNYQGSGVNGCIFTSKKSGYTDKSIFLPAAHYYSGTTCSPGTFADYGSASLYEDYPNYMWEMNFGPKYRDVNSARDRYYGQPIRAVCK